MWSNQYVATLVQNIVDTTDRVRVYELVQPEDWELPTFTAGAHIDVHIPGGLVRQYSLAGDPSDQKKYRIGVLTRSDGSGGSIALREAVEIGSKLSVSLPKNYFPLAADAKHHIFIAGGIGITPFLSMIPVVMRRSQTFELHMCSRTLGETPFLEELKKIYPNGKVRFYHDQDEAPTPLDVHALLKDRGDDEHVYSCGPTGLMDDVYKATRGWKNPSQAHFERFAAPTAPVIDGEKSYKINLAKQNRSVEVFVGETMLNALRRNGVAMKSGCEGGTCGDCKVRYLAGQPKHADFVLAENERPSFIIPCVSSSASDEITLDL